MPQGLRVRLPSELLLKRKVKMYTLRTRDGNLVTQKKNGLPFKYSTLTLARIGKRVLEADRKDTFSIDAAE